MRRCGRSRKWQGYWSALAEQTKLQLRRRSVHKPATLPTRSARSGSALVFLNGNILGVHRRPKAFVRAFREMRRRGKLGEFVSVYMQVRCAVLLSCGVVWCCAVQCLPTHEHSKL